MFSFAGRVCLFAIVLFGVFCKISQGENRENKLYNWFNGIEEWEVPEKLKRDLPFYQSGWDFEGRPVFVIEFGKWDVRKLLDSGKPEDTDLLYHRTEKNWYMMSRSSTQSNSSEEGAVLIIDANGLTAYQLASTKAVTFQLTSMRIGETFENHFVDIFIVNINFVVEAWINLIRPVAGRLIGRAVLISSNQEKIGAALRQKIPKDQLPPWLGGSDSFKPIKVL